jgi:predicted AAA+ superfamily ATPase
LEDFNVLVQTDQNDLGTVVVYDMQGKQMYSNTQEFVMGENNIHITTLHALPAGMYLVEVTTPKQKQIIRFMKGN